MTSISCPRCKLMVHESRMLQTPMICDCCGFVVSQSEGRVQASLEKTLLKSAVIASVILVALISFAGSWGSYSLEIIPLKVGDIGHFNSAIDMERLAQIGWDLKKFDLVERQYELLSVKDPANFVRLGKFQYSRKEYSAAAETYRKYFSLGIVNLDARYEYARALAEINSYDESAKNFEYVLGSRPKIRQVTVVQNYVAMLVKAKRFGEAQKVIEHVRHQDPSGAAKFMDTEYKVISERKNSRS
jgi:tetratricopeptide (TPR) repeat protein